MIVLLFPAMVRPASTGGFLDVSGSRALPSPRSASQLFDHFARHPYTFCQGFSNPIHHMYGPITLLGKDTTKIKKRNDHMLYILDRLIPDARESCNTSPEVLATLTTLNSDLETVEDRKKAYFLEWHSCVFKKLGEDLDILEFSYENCDESNAYIPELPCKEIDQEFKKTKDGLSGNGGDVGRRLAAADHPSQDDREDAEVENGNTHGDLHMMSPIESLFADNFFKNPREFCRAFDYPLRFNADRGSAIALLNDSVCRPKDGSSITTPECFKLLNDLHLGCFRKVPLDVASEHPTRAYYVAVYSCIFDDMKVGAGPEGTLPRLGSYEYYPSKCTEDEFPCKEIEKLFVDSKLGNVVL